jgi:hypothetical protein
MALLWAVYTKQHRQIVHVGVGLNLNLRDFGSVGKVRYLLALITEKTYRPFKIYVCVTLSIAVLIGNCLLFSCNKSILTFMHISNRSETKYNKSISSDAKDTTDVNLMHLQK